MAKILIGCETSGVVRNAFLAAGHDTWSCDILPSDDGSNRHIQDDVRSVMKMDNWDLMAVMHPPCTRLCNSGVRWLDKPAKNPIADLTPQEAADWPHMSEKEKLALTWRKLEDGAALFDACWNADIPNIAIENPVMHRHAKALISNFEDEAKRRSSYQPWQFGTEEAGPDNVRKRICFWKRGLPALTRTGTLDGSTARAEIHLASPGKDRWKIRSKFFPGIAEAMAQQWGDHAAAAYAHRAA
ncbi:hypothetical protein [Salipiger bermudensis]|uniref:DNA cytosine methyltransferase n=1 Tax=Salipiger bermudensis (strain DSM 26914 / JCM 13377 / KCTC 12554 / HTCC2601) TaxID=314265 RepID=Q0FLJ9_SALBH|nr:hypothetical protein [Salipiger bermudensis]EAU45099.1 hypothetical protein R2601_22971 [Salipiger bermudensis HTCC2601]